jgi:hypothetical protein
MSQQPQPQMYGTMPGQPMMASQGPQMMYQSQQMPGMQSMMPGMMPMQGQQQMPMNQAPELPGDKLSAQECAAYGVPPGAVWGRVVANEEEADMAADDDVRGTQV